MNLKHIKVLLGVFVLMACSSKIKTSETRTDYFSDFDTNVERIVNQIPEIVIPENYINIIEFSGQKPDGNGSYNFREDINKAIVKLSEMGGGTLHFPHTSKPEEWVKLTDIYHIKGPIELLDNIEIKIDHAVKLYFEFDPNAYLPNGNGVLRRYEGSSLYSFSPLIYAFNKKNIKISRNEGNGAWPIIDGDGESWVAWSREKTSDHDENGNQIIKTNIRDINNKDIPLKDRVFIDEKRDKFRPTMMEFLFCENVEVSGVKLINAPFWVVHPVFSKNLYFHDMLFDCQNVNNDGFDPESSDNILIENIIFDNHDDNVVAKAGRDLEGRQGVDVTGTELEHIQSPYIKNKRLGGPLTNLVFRNSVMQGHYGLAAGSEMSGGVDGIYMYNCHAPIFLKAGVFIKSSRVRGGYVKNVFVKDVNINNSHMALTLIPNYDGDTTSHFPPKFSNIHFKNIHVKNTNNSIRVFGWEDAITQDISFENIAIEKSKFDMSYNFIENVELINVSINDSIFNTTLTLKEANRLPPAQN